MDLNRQDDYVNYETAKLLKEKGFVNDWCVAYYEIPLTYTTTYHPLKFVNKMECNNINFNSWLCAAPTLQMAMKWLREVHNLNICIFIGEDSSCDADGSTVDMWHFWSYNVTNLFGNIVYDAYDKLDCVEYQSYEEACEAAIKYCLENLIDC